MFPLSDPEIIKVKGFFQDLGFPASSIDPRIIKNFKYTREPVEWLSIDYYHTSAQVLSKINASKKVSVTSSEFISEVSRMREFKDVLVCFIDVKGIGKGCLVSSVNIQKEITAIFSGDGFASCCKFAIKSAP